MELPTRDQILAEISYDSQSGLFTRNYPKTKRLRPGSPAGSLDGCGYRQIRIQGRLLKAHRLAWVIMTGLWPEEHLDHIDGNPDNNAWSNLRPASRTQNMWNAKRRADNQSGIKGVRYHKHLRKWQARITVRGRCIAVGTFDTSSEAEAALIKRRNELHAEFANHGNHSPT